MSNLQPFIPAWADKALSRPSAFDAAELEVLRSFYKAWEGLHAIPKDKIHRMKATEAAEKLVEQAHILRRMYV